MRSEAQRQASRVNGAKSRGPTTPEGKAITRFNGLTHKLCATQAVLPGEDPAAFQARRDALFDDWQPMSYTRALLVERLAVASWRLRRAVTSESALRARAADDAVRAFDSDRLAAVERAIDRFEDDPRAALTLLQSSALGLDRLLTSWGELDASLEDGPSGWDQRFHLRLMILLGHPHGTPLITAGPVPIASARLLASRSPGARPLPKGRGRGDGRGPPTAGGRGDGPAPGPAGARAGHVGGPPSCGRGGLGRHDGRGAAAAPLRDGAGPLAPRDDLSAHHPGPLRGRPAGAGHSGRDGRGPGGNGRGGRSRGGAGRSGDDRVAAARPRGIGAGVLWTVRSAPASPGRSRAPSPPQSAPRGARRRPRRGPPGAGQRPEISTHGYQKRDPDPVGARSARRGTAAFPPRTPARFLQDRLGGRVSDESRGRAPSEVILPVASGSRLG